jgi:nitrogen fixation protein FixH
MNTGIMKFHWGTGIAIGITLFAAFILTLVVKSFSVKPDMVAKDYYAYDLAYQSHYDKAANAAALKEKVKVNTAAGSTWLQFPSDQQVEQVTLKMYRPDNSNLDFSLNTLPDASGKLVIPEQQLISGRWDIQVEWKAAGKEYFQELQYSK